MSKMSNHVCSLLPSLAGRKLTGVGLPGELMHWEENVASVAQASDGSTTQRRKPAPVCYIENAGKLMSMMTEYGQWMHQWS